MATTVGLYYPFIHFQDEAWVKLAALYWDRIGRIVPKDYDTHDSPTVQRLKDACGFVWDEAQGPETKPAPGPAAQPAAYLLSPKAALTPKQVAETLRDRVRRTVAGTLAAIGTDKAQKQEPQPPERGQAG